MPNYIIKRDGDVVGMLTDDELAREIDGTVIDNDAADPAYEERYEYTVEPETNPEAISPGNSRSSLTTGSSTGSAKPSAPDSTNSPTAAARRWPTATSTASIPTSLRCSTTPPRTRSLFSLSLFSTVSGPRA